MSKFINMKIPITDKFLWDVFNALSSVEDAGRPLFHPARSMRDATMSTDDPIYQKYRKIFTSQEFSQLIYYLKRKNYIKVKNLEGKRGIMLTKTGVSKALLASFSADGGKKRKDGKWIMLTFDIPQKHKKSRMLLRSIIGTLGYKMFQQSIWVCPFDVSDTTEKLLQVHNLEKYVKIFLIEKLEN